MILFIVIISSFLFYYFQNKIYNMYAFKSLNYRLYFDYHETFEGDYVYLYEEIENSKSLPLIYVKRHINLPKGLIFADDVLKYSSNDIFSIEGHETKKYKYRVKCAKRGNYILDNYVIILTDLFGTEYNSKKLINEKEKTLIVLPSKYDIRTDFLISPDYSGDIVSHNSLYIDSILIKNIRDYTIYDPMNKINWLSSVAHNKLMVNENDFISKNDFNIILNMQSRDIELHKDVPSAEMHIERCIKLTASMLYIADSINASVSLISNYPYTSLKTSEKFYVSDDDIGKKIIKINFLNDGYSLYASLRMLSEIEYIISCPLESMLDHILNNIHLYYKNKKFIFISSYINQRMMYFHDMLKNYGIEIIYFITSLHTTALWIPKDIKIFYYTHE